MNKWKLKKRRKNPTDDDGFLAFSEFLFINLNFFHLISFAMSCKMIAIALTWQVRSIKWCKIYRMHHVIEWELRLFVDTRTQHGLTEEICKFDCFKFDADGVADNFIVSRNTNRTIVWFSLRSKRIFGFWSHFCSQTNRQMNRTRVSYDQKWFFFFQYCQMKKKV
jgi:hypothetical protein